MTWQPETEGIFLDLPAAQYFTAPGFSHSMSQHMDPPAKLPVYLAKPREAKVHQIIGTLTHSRILEPSKPLLKLVVAPQEYPAPADSSLVKTKKVSVGDMLKWSGNANYCKAWIAQQEADGNIVVTKEVTETINGMVESIANDEDAQTIFAEGKSEVAIFKRFNLGGSVLRKSRLDWVPDGSNVLVDVKTTNDASEWAFLNQGVENGYFTQAIFYLDSWNESHPDDQREMFIFIAVEKEPPYLVCCHRLSIHSRLLQEARGLNVARLQLYMQCCEKNEWPGYRKGFPVLKDDDWAVNKIKRAREALEAA